MITLYEWILTFSTLAFRYLWGFNLTFSGREMKAAVVESTPNTVGYVF